MPQPRSSDADPLHTVTITGTPDRSVVEPEPEPKLDIKLCIRLWYLHLKIFSFTFYNKFVEIFELLPCKTAYYVKRQKKFQKYS